MINIHEINDNDEYIVQYVQKMKLFYSNQVKCQRKLLQCIKFEDVSAVQHIVNNCRLILENNLNFEYIDPSKNPINVNNKWSPLETALQLLPCTKNRRKIVYLLVNAGADIQCIKIRNINNELLVDDLYFKSGYIPKYPVAYHTSWCKYKKYFSCFLETLFEKYNMNKDLVALLYLSLFNIQINSL